MHKAPRDVSANRLPFLEVRSGTGLSSDFFVSFSSKCMPLSFRGKVKYDTRSQNNYRSSSLPAAHQRNYPPSHPPHLISVSYILQQCQAVQLL